MISAKGLVEYAESVYRAKAIYMWGCDGEIGTKELLETKKKVYGAEHYKNLTVDKIEGRFCYDCSGLLTQISGENITASNYYTKCKEKGAIYNIPKKKVCLIFRQQGTKIVHVGIYLGNGYLIEMYDDCEKRKFNVSEWTYYGLPTWLEEQPDEIVVGGTVRITSAIKVYNNASNAKKGKSELPFTYPAGTYYVYKIHKATGAVNITKTKGTPGAWVILP